MKNRTAEEILNFTFAHLDKVLRENRDAKDEVRDKISGRSSMRWGQEDPARPDNLAGAKIRGGRT